jgi:hypothetical protein
MKSCVRFVFLFCLLFLTLHSYADQQLVNGVVFECGSIANKNIQGVPTASDLSITVTNVGAGQRMIMRYRVIVTSNKGQTFDSGPMGRQLSPEQTDSHRFPVFGKVGEQDEFPERCQFYAVQVCPTAIPASWPKAPGSAYYDPFRNGSTSSCKTPLTLAAVSISVPEETGGCAGVTEGNSDGTKWAEQYGIFMRPFLIHGAATLGEASSKAIEQAQAAGFAVLNDRAHTPFYGECGAPHGAVVGRRKISVVDDHSLPFGFWYGFSFKTAQTKEEAISNAMTECNSQLGLTNPNSYYVKAGITSCDLIDSF